MKKWFSSFFALVGLLCLPAHAQPLRLAIAPNPSSAIGLLAVAEGHLARAGLADFVVVPCLNGNDCTQRLVSGEADVAFGADTSVVLAQQTGAKFDLLATVAESRRSNRMVTRKAGGVQRPEDLKGRRIGYLAGTSSHYFSEAFLSFYGVSASDVQWVELDPKRAVDQLASGEVDAAALFPPNAQRALARLGEAGFEFPSPPVYTLSVNVLAAPSLDKERGTRLLQAFVQAEQQFRSQPDAAWAAVARRIQLSEAETMVARGDFTLVVHLDQSLIDSLEAQARWAVRRGIGGAAEPNFLPHFRPELLRAIDPRRVTVIK